jgi:Arc/MetJ family transcription regulator
MRTTIEIDDKLIRQAMRCSGAGTKAEAVDLALKLLLRLKAEEGVKALRGKIQREGNLEESRLSRFEE